MSRYFDPAQLGILPSMVPYIEMISSMLKQTIHERANAQPMNPARVDMYNQVCSQTDSNPVFHKLILQVSEHTAMLVDTERRNPQDAVNEAVQTTLAVYAALWYLRNPNAMPNDYQLRQEINNTASMAGMLEQRINNYLAQVRQSMQGFQQTMPGNWGTQPQNPYTVQQYNTPYNPHMPNVNSGWNNNGMGNGGMGGAMGSGAPMGFNAAPPVPVAVYGSVGTGSAFASASARDVFQPDPVQQVAYTTTAPAVVVSKVVGAPRVGTGRKVYVRNDAPHERAEIDSITFAPTDTTKNIVDSSGFAHTSQQWTGATASASLPSLGQTPAPVAPPVFLDATRDWTEAMPYAVVYDPEVNCVYQQLVDGKVREMLGKAKGGNVNYVDHEMDQDNLNAIAEHKRTNNKDRVIGIWRGVSAKTIPTAFTDDDTPAIPDVTIPTPHSVGKVLARNLDSALDEAEVIITEQLAVDPTINTETYTFEFASKTPMPIDSVALETALIDISECNDCFALPELVLAVKPLLSNVWYRQMTTLLTAQVNTVLRHRMGIVASIDDFIEDFGDLSDYLEKEYGQYVCETFLHHVDEILEAFAGGMQFSRREGYTDGQFVSVLWNWGELVLVVPVSYADISVACSEVSGLVVPTNSPELWRALRALLEQPCNFKSIWNRTIVTSDGMMFRVHQGYFDDTSAILEFVKKPD